jgi:hypothetical protein
VGTIRYQPTSASAAAWPGFILSLLSRPTREDYADAQTLPSAELRRIVRVAITHHVSRRAPRLVRAEEQQEPQTQSAMVEQAI